MSKKNASRVSAIISRLKGLVSISENFNRADGALGKALGTTSVSWTAVRGSWAIATNKASSSDAGSTYPISTLVFTKEDVTLGVDGVGPGVGTAFWVTDSNNWWGSYLDSTQSCSTCANTANPASYNTYFVPASGGNCASSYSYCSSKQQDTLQYSYYTFTDYGSSPCASPCQTFTPGACPYWSGTCCRCLGRVYNYICNGYTSNCNAYNTYYPASTNYAVASYNAVTYYSCNCVNNQSIKIIKNIAGTISQVASLAISGTVASFKTILSGSTITVRAYSGAGYTTQIGSDQTASSTGAVKSKKHGILKAGVTYSPTQTQVIDTFDVV